MKKRRSREQQHAINEALFRFPRTIALLNEYPAGVERERAFELVKAAVEETEQMTRSDYNAKIGRLSSAIDGATVRVVGDYLK